MKEEAISVIGAVIVLIVGSVGLGLLAGIAWRVASWAAG